MAHQEAVDQAFVQAPEHRPKPIISEAGSIPLIDLSPLFSDGVGMVVPAALVEQVEVASRDWGFFQVTILITINLIISISFLKEERKGCLICGT
jgi:hypothetical protein